MPAPTKGPISQRELARTLIALIDAAMAPNSTARKDQARAKIRQLLAIAHWRTPFIGHNLGARRSRFLNSIGCWTPTGWAIGGWQGDRIRNDHAKVSE